MQIYASIARLLPCYPRTCPLWLHMQLLRLLHPPLDWKCRTLSLTSNFFIWVHITISVDSVEKSISSHCYSNSHSLLTCIQYRYYATMYSKALSNKFCKHFSSRSRKMVATQSASNADKTLQTTYDIYCCVRLVPDVLSFMLSLTTNSSKGMQSAD